MCTWLDVRVTERRERAFDGRPGRIGDPGQMRDFDAGFERRHVAIVLSRFLQLA